MLIFTAGGPRSIDPADVIAIYCGGGDSRYTHCTLVLLVGTEVSGAINNDSLTTHECSVMTRLYRRRSPPDQ